MRVKPSRFCGSIPGFHALFFSSRLILGCCTVHVASRTSEIKGMHVLQRDSWHKNLRVDDFSRRMHIKVLSWENAKLLRLVLFHKSWLAMWHADILCCISQIVDQLHRLNSLQPRCLFAYPNRIPSIEQMERRKLNTVTQQSHFRSRDPKPPECAQGASRPAVGTVKCSMHIATQGLIQGDPNASSIANSCTPTCSTPPRTKTQIVKFLRKTGKQF
jgi:hypothetical protein